MLECIDSIQYKMEDIQKFLAEREWVLIRNPENLKNIRNPDIELDVESFQKAAAQCIRFKRVVDSTYRGLERIKSSCEDFGGVDENL